MDLLTEIAKKMGFKYKVQLVKDGSYGRQDESGNWNGMIGEVVRGVSIWKLTFRRVKGQQMPLQELESPSCHLWLTSDASSDRCEQYHRGCWRSFKSTSYFLCFATGGRPCTCSPDSHCISGESSGDDQTLHADRHQHPAEEGLLRGSLLLWFSDSLHSQNVGLHTHCLLGDSCLHVCCCQVGYARNFNATKPILLIDYSCLLKYCAFEYAFFTPNGWILSFSAGSRLLIRV